MQQMKRITYLLIAGLLSALPFVSPAVAHAQSAPAGAPAYVALGDSVAAGLGLASSAGTGQSPQCGRSTAAYAYQVARAKNLELEHLACSGATVGDLFTS